VSPLLLALVQAALRAARVTGGAVDPTVGGALSGLGYDRDFPAVPAESAGPLVIRRVPGWWAVEVDPDAGTVRVPAGVVLDLGATAKAYAADRAARDAAAAAGCGVLVSLGGDIAVAGSGPPAAGPSGWPTTRPRPTLTCPRCGSVPAGWPRPRPRSAAGGAAGSGCTTSSTR
jgi:thiamine biosynthesis lipoprotein